MQANFIEETFYFDHLDRHRSLEDFMEGDCSAGKFISFEDRRVILNFLKGY